MSNNWTDAQLDAIEASGGSVLVSAAAGSGKTAVLVERVIRMITREENPVDADRLLIVTFTRDAAAEMKQRISDALSALLERDPADPQLLRQRQLLYNASISTIDSFCAGLIREYFHALDISPDFRNAEEQEAALLKADALDASLEYFYQNGGSGFRALLDAFSGKEGDKNLRATVERVMDFLETQPFPNDWLDSMLSGYKEENVADSLWGRIITEYAHNAVAHAVTLTENAKSAVTDDKLSEKLIPVLDDDLCSLASVQKALLGGDWDGAVSALNLYTPKRMPTPRGYTEHSEKVFVAESRKQVKNTLSKLKKYMCRTQDEARDEFAELYVICGALFDLVRDCSARYNASKREKNILTFADAELLTVRLLAESDGRGGYVKTALAEEISARFDAVIVDEFQDVNDVQNLIFDCVSRNGGNIFVVGDVKQSIYGFRQAKPGIFISRRRLFPKYDREKNSYPATIILDRNFRSRYEVCETVNFIFSRIMTEQAAQMDYTADERLNTGAEYPESGGCDFELCVLDKKSFDGEDDFAYLEARYIARRIRELMSMTVTVKGGSRKATYGDFAIMLRSPKGTAQTYVRALIESGIPAYSEENESAFDALEVRLLLDLLRVINNPSLDIPMLGVMCSPLYGFTPDELAVLRAGRRKCSLYQALTSASADDPKAARFLRELKAFSSIACTCAADELIGCILDRTSLPAVTAAVKGGADPQSNLNLIRTYASDYVRGGRKTLSDFILFVDRMIESRTKLPSASVSGADSVNAVRVLSIHKSKGLEYPVCFLANASKQFNQNDLRSDVLIDSHAGLGIKRKIGVCRYNTLPKLAVEIQMRRDSLAEEMRVLYVALTRAREKLIVVGSVDSADKYFEGLYSKLAFGKIIEPYTVSESRCYLDWIGLCALCHPSVRRDLASTAEGIILKENYPTWIYNKINGYESLGISEAAEVEEEAPAEADDDFDYGSLLKKNLAFKYRNRDILGLPLKVSASQVAHSQSAGYYDRVTARPRFISAADPAGVERGTAHHRFLQHCDFVRARGDIDSEIERLTSLGRLEPEQAELIDREKLSALIRSRLFDRVIASGRVYREERFAAEIAPSLIFDGYDKVETDRRIVMQGAVDLAFEENGRLVIVDYKTDRVGDIGRLKALYKKQLELYSEAMRQCLQIEVGECIICSVHLNDWVSL